MTLSDAVAKSRWTRRLAFLWQAAIPLSTLKAPANRFASAKQKRERVELAEISLGR